MWDFKAYTLVTIATIALLSYPIVSGGSVVGANATPQSSLKSGHTLKDNGWKNVGEDEEKRLEQLREKVNSFHSSKLTALDGSMCGMLPTSQLVTMDTGTKYCCHYRKNVHKLQGEVYTYHLARVLGFTHRVPLTMATAVLYTEDRFEGVRSKAASEAKWPQGATIVCSEYVDDLSDVVLPPVLRSVVANEKMIDDKESFDPMWVELVVLDYLTGNTDRLVNLLTNFKYNSGILSSPVHNLALEPGGQLILFDHETSFWIGYQFSKDNEQIRTSQSFFMEKLCTFPQSLIERLSTFCQRPTLLTEQLLDSSRVLDLPTMKLVPPLSHDVQQNLQIRLTLLCSHLVQRCRTALPNMA